MKIWRINLKPGAANGIDPRQFCIKNNIVGVGWGVNHPTDTLDWKTYKQKAIPMYPEKGDKGWEPALNAIHNQIKTDDLIWTRDWQGIYYIGRILSEWSYDNSEECRQADIVNVRKCEWKKIGTIQSVPGKIVNSFIPPRTVQQVKGESIENFSKFIFNKKSGHEFYQLTISEGSNIFSLLSSEDCEDALALYLQLNRNYMIIPSSCKSSTMNYEYELINRSNGQGAVVQVKNGNVNLDAKDFANIESKIYLLTTKGQFIGNETDKLEFINPKSVEEFMFDQKELMPDTIKNWLEIFERIKKPVPNNGYSK